MIARLAALGVVCALGQGKQAVAEALFAGSTHGMQPVSYTHLTLPTTPYV